MEEKLNLYQKLAKIRKQVEVMQKNKKGYGYKYVSEDEILAKVSVFMDKYDISLIPSVNSETARVDPYTYKKVKSTEDGNFYEDITNEVIVGADMTWTWVNNSDPEEKIIVPWFLVGQQSDASQAFGSGLTYAGRYFLLKFFNIATPDSDPDSFRNKQKEAEAAEDKMVADEIVKRIDAEVRAFIEAHDDQSGKVKEFISKYVKGGNYFAISDSATASRLLKEFKENFNT